MVGRQAISRPSREPGGLTTPWAALIEEQALTSSCALSLPPRGLEAFPSPASASHT